VVALPPLPQMNTRRWSLRAADSSSITSASSPGRIEAMISVLRRR
jgi:hypothetical protein